MHIFIIKKLIFLGNENDKSIYQEKCIYSILKKFSCQNQNMNLNSDGENQSKIIKNNNTHFNSYENQLVENLNSIRDETNKNKLHPNNISEDFGSITNDHETSMNNEFFFHNQNDKKINLPASYRPEDEQDEDNEYIPKNVTRKKSDISENLSLNNAYSSDDDLNSGIRKNNENRIDNIKSSANKESIKNLSRSYSSELDESNGNENIKKQPPLPAPRNLNEINKKYSSSEDDFF